MMMAELHNVSTVSKIETRADTTPMQDINKVYEACKFGRFHVKMLFISFVGHIASILVTSSSSYLLPSAECDLNMNLRQKGILNAMPYLGTFFSSVISGFLMDTFGRIMFLKIGFGGVFCWTIVAASSQNYEMLAIAKFFEGLLFATSVSALSSLTSEFCHSSIRDRVMLFQSSFAAIGQIIIPAMAWGILVQDWRVNLFNGFIVLNTWNFYLYAMSLWSLTAFLLYCTMPESPKYLVTQKKYNEAKQILINMYTTNTGNAAYNFPIPHLWNNEIKEIKLKKSEELTKETIYHQITDGLQNVKPMFKRPLVLYLTLTGSMQFVVLGMYNVVRLWFPQLSTIVEHRRLDGERDLCVLLDIYTTNLKMRGNLTSTVCIPALSGAETYINSIIIGFACLFPYFISGVFVNKVGKKVLLVISGLICIGASLGLRWASSKTIMVTLFSVAIAVAQILKSLVQVVIVEIFPTTMRSLAMSIVMVIARCGTLMGNIAFPILLDIGCALPFYTMAGMMIFVTILAVFIPKRKQ